MPSVWNSLEAAKLVASVLTPLVVILIGAWFNQRLKKIEEARIKEVEQRQRADEDRKREIEERTKEIERIYTPHIEFNIDCDFFGPTDGQYIANFLLAATNRGRVVHKFPSIRLRVRGIKKGESIEQWEKHPPRIKFPYKIFEAEVVPPDWNFIYVEPGVTHRITFATAIPLEYSYLLGNAEFRYDPSTPQKIETVFALPGSEEIRETKN